MLHVSYSAKCSENDDDEDEEFLGMSVEKLWDEGEARLDVVDSIVAQTWFKHKLLIPE